MNKNMTVTVVCEDCGQKVFQKKDMDVLLPAEVEEHRCRPSLHDCRAQFGASDVETLAQAMYYAFHRICPCSCHGDDAYAWDKFSGRRDEIVDAFRAAAVDVALKFSDGQIGAVYYAAN